MKQIKITQQQIKELCKDYARENNDGEIVEVELLNVFGETTGFVKIEGE